HQEQCHVQVSRSSLSRRRPQVDNPRTQLASHGISTISRVHRSSLAAISHLNLLVPRSSPSQEYCGGKGPCPGCSCRPVFGRPSVLLGGPFTPLRGLFLLKTFTSVLDCARLRRNRLTCIPAKNTKP